MTPLDEHYQNARHRATLGVPPLPLTIEQTAEVIHLLAAATSAEGPALVKLLQHRVPAGVHGAAKLKAEFLNGLARGEAGCATISQASAVMLLGTMLGGHNVPVLVALLDVPSAAAAAADALSHTLLVYDHFNDVREKAQAGNAEAMNVMRRWADAEWLTARPRLPGSIALTVLRTRGEINTDDLSPAQDASSRPDIPLHALSMHRYLALDSYTGRGDETPFLAAVRELRVKGLPIAYVGDVVGTGSSRKSAVNSMLWWIGRDVPYVPNKRSGGICLAKTIAPIFFNTLEDAGALPIEMDVSGLRMGDEIELRPYDGVVLRNSAVVADFKLKNDVLLDEVWAGGRIPLIIGRSLTARARDALRLPPSDVFRLPAPAQLSSAGYTLAQKMVGRAAGMPPGVGIRPGTFCEPRMTSVGSQDGTGPMTRNELTELACLGFSADLVLQSFCHTAAYPTDADLAMHRDLPKFMRTRGAVSLHPGDGIIHSWLNRMLVPDTVGTGADSHTRFPIGISFPAGSGLVAFAAATGVMPLDMPESVLVRFEGEMQAGITIRDLVHAIPLQALKEGLLTLDDADKKNVFSGRILEIEGLPRIKVEQAFELADASAERSASACTVRLAVEPVVEYLTSNVSLLERMLAQGYGDVKAIRRRIEAMQDWLAAPQLLEPDKDSEYAAVLTIDLGAITEPIVCCPNDPDNVKPLSEVAGTAIDEVFIGSCMTNIGHFRAAGKLLENSGSLATTLWVVPPTKMDEERLTQEGHYDRFNSAGARIEMPGCSLCVGNQARVKPGATVMSTSTRNFPNRMGTGANVFLGSAELAAMCAALGKIPTTATYLDLYSRLDPFSSEIYAFLDFSSPPAKASLPQA